MAVKKKIDRAPKAYAEYLALVEVETADGVFEITLPRVDMKCIMRVADSVARLTEAVQKELPDGIFNQATDSGNPDSGNMTSSLISALPAVLPQVLSEICTVLAQYLEEDEEWVASLSMEDIMNLFTPFLTHILGVGTSMFSRFVTQNQNQDQPNLNEQSKTLESSPLTLVKTTDVT